MEQATTPFAKSQGVPPDSQLYRDASKQRSPLERLFVRSLMAVLLVVLMIEAGAWLRMKSAHWRLTHELHRAEQEDYRITRGTVDAIMSRRPPDQSRTLKAPVGEERYDLYYFSGLLKQRELCVHYGVSGIQSEPEVIEITTIMPDELFAN